MPAFVEFQNVFKTYKMGEIEINAVNDVSFAINEGEFAVVVGQSGAGKTTITAQKEEYLLAVVK